MPWVCTSEVGNDSLIFYQLVGYGERKLVFVQGLAGRSCDWWQQIDHFSKACTVCVIDNRGAGWSTMDFAKGRSPSALKVLGAGLSVPFRQGEGNNEGLDRMALDVLDVILALRWTEFHVIGISMGGMIAQRLAYIVSSSREQYPNATKEERGQVDDQRPGRLIKSWRVEANTKLITSIDDTSELGLASREIRMAYARLSLLSLSLFVTMSHMRSLAGGLKMLHGIFSAQIAHSLDRQISRFNLASSQAQNSSRTLEKSRKTHGESESLETDNFRFSVVVPPISSLQSNRVRKLFAFWLPLFPMEWLEQYRELDLFELDRRARTSPLDSVFARVVRRDLEKCFVEYFTVSRLGDKWCGNVPSTKQEIRTFLSKNVTKVLMLNAKYAHLYGVAKSLLVEQEILDVADCQAESASCQISDGSGILRRRQEPEGQRNASRGEALYTKLRQSIREKLKYDRLTKSDPPQKTPPERTPKKTQRLAIVPMPNAITMYHQLMSVTSLNVNPAEHALIRKHVRKIFILTAQKDTVIPWWGSVKIAKQIDADLWLRFQNAGHFVSDQYRDIVNTFLQAVIDCAAIETSASVSLGKHLPDCVRADTSLGCFQLEIKPRTTEARRSEVARQTPPDLEELARGLLGEGVALAEPVVSFRRDSQDFGFSPGIRVLISTKGHHQTAAKL